MNNDKFPDLVELASFLKENHAKIAYSLVRIYAEWRRIDLALTDVDDFIDFIKSDGTV